MEDHLAVRRELLQNCRQIIVKAGTRLLTDQKRIATLVSGIAAIRQRGIRVLLVSSGAVGMGMKELGMTKRPQELSAVQALAAIGQCKLMSIYEEECAKFGFKTAQLLLTAADIRSRERYLNVMNCINALWDKDILPIVNENDSVSVDELKFGDNDYLCGVLASLTSSKLAVILTTEEGLRSRNTDGSLGERLSVVPKVDASIRGMAGGTDNSEMSIGGMSSKLRAAELVNASGACLWIADGREPGILERILNGDDVGTVFLPGDHKVSGHKRFLRFFADAAGFLLVDLRAAAALVERGSSLLPSGVIAVEGNFKRGDTVNILDATGSVIARGLVNYSSEDCIRIKGAHSDELPSLLGHPADDEMVHRDNLTLVGD